MKAILTTAGSDVRMPVGPSVIVGARVCYLLSGSWPLAAFRIMLSNPS